MPAEGIHRVPLDAGRLHVELDGEAEPRGQGEPVVERRRAGRQLGAVREDERAAGRAEHVELDGVEAVRRGGLDRLERVLGGERCGAAVPDAEHPALAPAEIHQLAADDDDREVVGELAAGEGAAVLGDHARERMRRQRAVLGEQRVEPLEPVQLSAPPRFDHAVGVHDDRGARGQVGAQLLVLLPGVDAEHEALRLEAPHGAVGEDDPRRRMPRARACDLAAGRRRSRGTSS